MAGWGEGGGSFNIFCKQVIILNVLLYTVAPVEHSMRSIGREWHGNGEKFRLKISCHYVFKRIFNSETDTQAQNR
jgi:hypothetical protein